MRVMQCLETGLYVGATVVLKLNADGSPLAPEKEGTTGKLVEFNKSWCRVSLDGKVYNFRKKYLQIHADSLLSPESLQEKFVKQQQDRKVLRTKLQEKEDAMAVAFAHDEQPTGIEAAGSALVEDSQNLPRDITPLPVSHTFGCCHPNTRTHFLFLFLFFFVAAAAAAAAVVKSSRIHVLY